MSENWFNLRTMSENGILLLKAVMDLQSLMDRMSKKNSARRMEGARLLEKIADCLTELEIEVRAGGPKIPVLVGRMRTYIEHFEPVFVPLLGKQTAAKFREQLLELFVSTPEATFSGGTYGPMIGGFLELKKLTASGEVDELHTNSSIATLSLVEGQLRALADVLEFAEIATRQKLEK